MNLMKSMRPLGISLFLVFFFVNNIFSQSVKQEERWIFSPEIGYTLFDNVNFKLQKQTLFKENNNGIYIGVQSVRKGIYLKATHAFLGGEAIKGVFTLEGGTIYSGYSRVQIPLGFAFIIPVTAKGLPMESALGFGLSINSRFFITNELSIVGMVRPAYFLGKFEDTETYEMRSFNFSARIGVSYSFLQDFKD